MNFNHLRRIHGIRLINTLVAERRYTTALKATINELVRRRESTRDESKDNSAVNVYAWIRHVRRQKRFTFIEVCDGSTPHTLQVVLPSADANRLDSGALIAGVYVHLEGSLEEAPANTTALGVELHARQCSVLGECDGATYPLQPKEHSNEFLRTRVPHLRARTARHGAMLRVRSRVEAALHSYMSTLGFVHVHTPLITQNDCEGGGSLFELSAPTDNADERFFGRRAYLTVSSQLHLEAFALALSRVYTLQACFRAEHSTGGRHLAEFRMFEPEMTNASLSDTMDVCEHSVGSVASALLSDAQCMDDLRLLGGEEACDRVRLLAESESAVRWTRIRYAEALRRLRERHGYDIEFGADLLREHERALVADTDQTPVFVTHWPRTLRPFYMRSASTADERRSLDDDDEAVDDSDDCVLCFDLIAPRVGELAGGSEREHVEQRLDVPSADLHWYAELRRYGTAPHAGFGLGFDRLVQWFTGADSLRDVAPLGRTQHWCPL